MTEIIRGAPSPDRPASWVVVERETGRAVCEISGQSVADKINTAKYEAIPIVAYLQSLNRAKP